MGRHKTFTCCLLDKKYLKKVKICLEYQEKEEAIAFFKWGNSNEIEIKINYADIDEIREGLKTDAWINSEENLDKMLDNARIGQGKTLTYFSIVCKSGHRILPGETHDFVTDDEELAGTLRELSRKLKGNIQLSRNVPEEDCLFDHSLSHDIDQPMSHYFIASSHNTYLTGHQMTSKSSYEIYRNILLDGCRCIEIDIWEGKCEPVVTHKFKSYLKGTTTSEILFGKVLEIINKFAFVTSQYPLILSIENHLEKRSQKQLAKMLNQILSDKIFIGEIGTQYPLLSAMKGKIFVKDYKKLRIEPKSKRTEQSVKIDDRAYVDCSGHSTDKTLDNEKLDLNYDDYDYDQWDSDEEDDLDDNKRDQRHLDEAASLYQDGGCFGKLLNKSSDSLESLESNYNGPTYPQMINYFETKKFKDIDTCIKEFKFNQMFSQNEAKSMEILEQLMASGQNTDKFNQMLSRQEMVSQKLSTTRRENKYRQFTRTNMVRVYPRALRQDSSNYNPVCHWYAGAQMVALNYQTASVEMQINWAQFALNGGCGYVLKPQYLRTQTPKPADIDLQIVIVRGEFGSPFSVDMKNELKVTTRVYCPDTGKHRIKKALKRDQYSNEPKETKMIVGNAINPAWNDSMTYRLSNPELSFVLFSLMNGTDCTVGQYMIAVQAMRTGGLRSIDLYDDKMNKIPSAKIYVQVSKT